MQDSTPTLITPEQFNTKVRGWTISVRQRMAANAPKSTGADSRYRTAPKLAASLTHIINKIDDISTRIKYQFQRHGVFIHYGVGRGYIRQGGVVVRSSRSRTSGINRRPDDWFDVEIRNNMEELAEIAQEFYGDWALEDMLSKIEKFTIQRKV
ncbi:MAG TPA: hypothetical protein P5084_15700 [Paludibacter sp.]|nr:hypothetical protein [Paludibacter sp.]